MRSQTYYLDITPPGHDKGTFVEAIAKRLGISTDAVATIGDMQNDLPMFASSGISFAMGNATDKVKKRATHVTDLNERDGFASAMEMVMKLARSVPALALGRSLRVLRSPAVTSAVSWINSESSSAFALVNPLYVVGHPATSGPIRSGLRTRRSSMIAGAQPFPETPSALRMWHARLRRRVHSICALPNSHGFRSAPQPAAACRSCRRGT